MVEMYDQEGKTARANQVDQNAGHTQGKRPDALFRGVLFRLAVNVRENQQVVEQRLQTEESVAAALKRVLKVGEQAAQHRDLKALRCFRVKSKDEAGQDIIRRIFAPSRQRQLTENLWTPRSQYTGNSTGSPAGRLCFQNQGVQTGATAGLWDGFCQHQESEENPQTQGPDRGRGRRGGLITPT